MKRLRTLIVDDEPLAVERLVTLSADHPVIDIGGAAGDGIFEAGFILIGFEFGNVGVFSSKSEGVDGRHLSIPLNERSFVSKQVDPLLAAKGKVVVAFGANLQAFFELFGVEDFAATGAFFPQAVRNIPLAHLNRRIFFLTKS